MARKKKEPAVVAADISDVGIIDPDAPEVDATTLANREEARKLAEAAEATGADIDSLTNIPDEFKPDTQEVDRNLVDLHVEYVATSSLIPYANNAKLHPDEQIDQIAASIERFGFADPIGVWTNPAGEMEIVEGHGRVLAANKIGIDEVPIIRLDYMTDEERRAYVHVHNQTTLTSGFDYEVLDTDLESLCNAFNFDDFGFDMKSLDIESFFVPEDERVGAIAFDKTPEKIICPECGHEWTK